MPLPSGKSNSLRLIWPATPALPLMDADNVCEAKQTKDVELGLLTRPLSFLWI